MADVLAFPNSKAAALALLDEIRAKVESGEAVAVVVATIYQKQQIECRVVTTCPVPVIEIAGAAWVLDSFIRQRLVL
jgi:hypothetical protein